MTGYRIFFDTEFIEDGNTIDMISIGMIRDDGATYYAEIAECDHSRADDWVKANVLPLPTGPMKPRAQVAREIIEFAGEKPEFWAYYGDYDWVALCRLFGRLIDLPKGWPMFCRDVKQLCVDLGDPRLPSQEAGAHNALSDAIWTRKAYEFLIGRTGRSKAGTPVASPSLAPGCYAGASDAELRCCGCGRETINRVKQCSCITNVGRGPGSPGTEWMRDPASAIVGKASGPTDPDQLRGFAAYCRSGVCIDKSDDDLLARKFEQAAVLVAERDAWKDVCRRAGVCMSCALGSPEPHGCFDCLNTGWEGGAPAGFVKEGAIASLSAEVERLTGYYAQVMSGQSVAIITRLETSERALAAEREAHERDVRQFSELADANRRRAEAAEADAQAMRAALERSARFVRDELDVRRASMIGPEGTADCPEDRAYIEDAQALLAQIEQALS